ncbi:MAG: alpha/beta hydrolase domain-containing protein [Gammaproteobacteria bacterium]
MIPTPALCSKLSINNLLAPAFFITLFSMAANAVVPLPTDFYRVRYDDNPDPTLRDEPFLAWHEDLSQAGYVEREYFFSGTAQEYRYVDDAGQSPLAEVRPGRQGQYTTRMIVRRPNQVKNFNGVVYLEILNATAGYDNAPHWNLTYDSIIADGAAYVGVTYSDLTADFLSTFWGEAHDICPANDPNPTPCGSDTRNKSRYLKANGTAILNIPRRAFTWDILNQAAALIRAGAYRGPFQNFTVDTVIAVGYSQSARYVTTYGNSFYPSYSELGCTAEQEDQGLCTTPIVDGFIVAAGGSNSSEMDGVGSHPPGDRRNCENALNREAPCIEGEIEPPAVDPLANDLPKFMRFTTESDIKSVRARQDEGVNNPADYDQPYLRTYEAAGTSHVDFWGTVVNRRVGEYQFGIPADPNPASGCDKPMNPIRTGIPLSAIQHRMWRWIKFDEPPPPNRLMEWEGDFSTFDANFNPAVDWLRDEDGNALGGVRPARMNVPLGAYNGQNTFSGGFSPQLIFCTTIIGAYEDFTSEEILNRYGTRQSFAALTWWNAYLAYLDGFLLAVDAATILQEAKNYEGLPE